MKKSTLFIVQSAVIAGLYAALTIAQNLLLPGTASMAVQFRIAEVLTVLAFFTPSAITGLTVGCIIANISSIATLGVYDMVFGSIATLIAVSGMYALRNFKIKSVPFLGLLLPALANGVIIGFEIDFFFVGSFSFHFADFLLQGGLVALGELGVLLILGTPLYLYLNKNSKIFKI